MILKCILIGQERWLEVSSVSNFESYQSNRLQLRFRNENARNQLCHTLNGKQPYREFLLVENNQTENGILIPKSQEYTRFNIID